MEADEKKCPKCAETIKAEAQVCRFCGHSFVAQPAPSGPMGDAGVTPPSPKSSTAKNLGIGCLAVVALLVVVGMFGSGGKSGSTSSATNGSGAAAPAMDVTAAELVRAYKANEAAAQLKYGSTPLRVSATIYSIDLGFDDKPYLVLNGGEMFSNPQAKLDEPSQAKAGSLSKGGKVMLVCQSVSEIVGTPMLDDCALQ